MITVNFPGRRPRQYPDGTIVTADQPQDAAGTIVVQYDEAGQPYREERYLVGTAFHYDLPPVNPPAPPPPAPNAQGQQQAGGTQNAAGAVRVGSFEVAAPNEPVITTGPERTFKILTAVLFALFLATAAGIAVYFVSRGETKIVTVAPPPPPPAPVTPPAPPPPALPKCADKVRECEELAKAAGADDAPCKTIDTDCQK